MRPEEIQVALHIPTMEYHDSMDMLTWMRDDARGKVSCDIFVTDIHDYLPSFHRHISESRSSVAHFLFFTDPRDAMMVKLRWMAQKFQDAHWLHIRADDRRLAVQDGDRILVDSSVQHVR